MHHYMLHVFVVSTSYFNMYGKIIFPRHHLWLANTLCFSDNGFAQIYWLMVAAISELFFSVSMTTTVTCLHLQQREGGRPFSFSLQQNAAPLDLQSVSYRQTLHKCKPAFLLPTVGTNVLRGGLSAFYKMVPFEMCVHRKNEQVFAAILPWQWRRLLLQQEHRRTSGMSCWATAKTHHGMH